MRKPDDVINGSDRGRHDRDREVSRRVTGRRPARGPFSLDDLPPPYGSGTPSPNDRQTAWISAIMFVVAFAMIIAAVLI